MPQIFLSSVRNFKSNPDHVLNELQVMLSFELSNTQHQKAKLLGVQAAAGGTISLYSLHNVWSRDALLVDFASVLNHRILGNT